MITHEGVDRNFRFMVLEVIRQLEQTYAIVSDPRSRDVHRIVSRDNYVDILKGLIEKKIISYYRNARQLDRKSADMASAVGVVTVNLERIADFCVSVAKMVGGLTDASFVRRYAFEPYFYEIREVLELVPDGLADCDTNVSMRLCECEARLNEMYKTDCGRIKQQLRSGEHIDDLLNCLEIFHYLERMGDSLLNIGEAILFATTGEKLKIHEYLALQETLDASREHVPEDADSIEFKWETRSGSRIGKVGNGAAARARREAIFKRGDLAKLQQEKRGIERWESVMPGLPPKVLEFRDDEQNAALLLEFLDGLTLQDLTFSAATDALDRAMTLIEETLTEAWERTRRMETTRALFMRQLEARMDDVLRVHPEFRNSPVQVGAMAVGSLTDLIIEAERVEQELAAPFSVMIHGDLNSDNVIFDRRHDRIHFIDLHRAEQMDYVQDISVFMVSNFRMPVFDAGIRERLNGMILRVFQFARRFSTSQEDVTFEARLALGLARSLITSTRFELNEEFARLMKLRAVYLLERLIDHKGRDWSGFKLASDALTY